VTNHIVAIGGAGLSEPLLRQFVLGLAGKPQPRLVYLPTAMGDAPEGIVAFYEAYGAEPCQPSHLNLFNRKDEDLAAVLLGQDIIYVGGGNTANMLAIWRLHGVDRLLRQAWEGGIVLCGSSAGSICWFEGGITDSFGPRLSDLRDGLGFLPGSNCPHYDSEPRRRPVYQQAVAGGFLGGLAAEDGVALHFVGRDLREVITARPSARAYRLEANQGQTLETPLPARYLG